MSATLSDYVHHELRFLRLNFRKTYKQYQMIVDCIEWVYNKAECENDFLNPYKWDMSEFYQLEGNKYDLFCKTISSHCNGYLKWYMKNIIKDNEFKVKRLRKYFGPFMPCKKGIYTLTTRSAACRIAQQVWRQTHGKVRDWYEISGS